MSHDGELRRQLGVGLTLQARWLDWRLTAFERSSKLHQITLSWIVFGMIIYANSGRNLFVPSLFLISVTGLEGAAMAGASGL